MIYFMQPVSGGPVKIGTSENVPALSRRRAERVIEAVRAVLEKPSS